MNDEESADQPFLMTVHDVFSVTGRGTVIVGRIESGKIRAGEEIEISGSVGSRRAVVAGIEIIKRQQDAGCEEGNIGLIIDAVGKEELERGMVVRKPH